MRCPCSLISVSLRPMKPSVSLRLYLKIACLVHAHHRRSRRHQITHELHRVIDKRCRRSLGVAHVAAHQMGAPDQQLADGADWRKPMLPGAADSAAGIDNLAAAATGKPNVGRVVVGTKIARGAPSRGLGQPHRGLQSEADRLT